MIPARQLWLPLGSQSHFDLLHGQHRQRVALAHSDGRWKERGAVDHETARALVVDIASRQDWDAYLSQAGFSGGRRVVDSVAVLPVVFVDLDTYNVPGLDALSSDELLDRILAQHPWLPVPTMTIASGRGHYLEWVLPIPLPREHLDRWQAVEDCLVDLLAPFGADPKARDAARVLRIVGGTNQRNGREVMGYQTGAPVPFETLERLVLNNAAPAPAPAPEPPTLEVIQTMGEAVAIVRRESKATAKQRAQHLKPYRLHLDRMHDYVTLATLRGSPRLGDGRHRLLYCYAVSGTWYWSGIEQAEQELDHFSGQHFSNADRYKRKRVQTVLDRMEQQLSGRVARVRNGQREDWRYRLQNSTILRMLEVTAQEQQQLRTIIGKDEVQRRRVGRRRAAGMEPRDAYLGRAQERRSKALEMRSRGMTLREIGDALGVTKQAVSLMLKR